MAKNIDTYSKKTINGSKKCVGKKNFFVAKKFFCGEKKFFIAKKSRLIYHSTRLVELNPTVSKSFLQLRYEQSYRLNYSCDFGTLTRYNSRLTRERPKIFADSYSSHREEQNDISFVFKFDCSLKVNYTLLLVISSGNFGLLGGL